MLDDIIEKKYCPITRTKEDWHYWSITIENGKPENLYKCNDCGLQWQEQRILHYHDLMVEFEKYTKILFDKTYKEGDEIGN